MVEGNVSIIFSKGNASGNDTNANTADSQTGKLLVQKSNSGGDESISIEKELRLGLEEILAEYLLASSHGQSNSLEGCPLWLK